LWGYIAPRYLGDFVPFLVLASAVAVADIFRRLEGRQRSVRVGAVAVMALVALFSIAANVGMAIVPNEEWDTTQVLNYVQAQNSLSNLTGHPLEANVVRGNSLPPWGPAGQLYVIGNCNGLYISNGERYSTVPSEQFVRTTWMTVELGQAFQHTFRMTVKSPPPAGTVSVRLVSAGENTVIVSVTPTTDPNLVRLRFGVQGAGQPVYGYSVDAPSGTTHTVVVTTDPVKHSLQVTMDGVLDLGRTLLNEEPIHADIANSQTQVTQSPLAVTDETGTTPQPTLCQSLIH
jgi:hypothetical protein